VTSHNYRDSGAQLSDVGELLRSTRRKRNLSLAEVAAATRIKAVYLEALEDSEYSVLPGTAYVTGFIRNYARFLGLHPDEVLEDFYAFRPPPSPVVKPATRVLASVQTRRLRKRFVWTLLSVAILLACGFAIKQYNAGYDHSYAASPPHLTPQNLGANLTKARIITRSPRTARVLLLHLRATSPVWVRVTADGKRVFQGLLHHHGRAWTARASIYVMTYDGSRVKAVRNGTRLGSIAARPGLGVWSATPSGWKRIS
jgi:transcriptional regulator with XRE-family HTH domain